MFASHRCEVWWNQRYACPFSKLGPPRKEDDSGDDEFVAFPAKKKKAEAKAKGTVEDLPADVVPIAVPALPEPTPLFPYPERVPGVAALETISPKAATNTTTITRYPGPRLRTTEYEEPTPSVTNERHLRELETLRRKQESVPPTFYPLYRSGQWVDGSYTGAGAESLRFSEVALAEAYRRRQANSRPSSKIKGGTAPGGEDAAVQQTFRPTPQQALSAPTSSGGLKQPVQDVITAAAITAAIVAGGEIIRRSRNKPKGGSSQGAGQPRRGGGIIKKAVIKATPRVAYKFVKPSSKAYKTQLAKNLGNRRSKN